MAVVCPAQFWSALRPPSRGWPAVPADGARAPDGFRMGRQGVLLVGGSPWLVALPVPLALGPQGLLPGGSAVATDPGALPVPSCFFLCRDLSDPHNQGRGLGEGGRTRSWRSQPELLCLSGFRVQEGAPWLFKGHSHVPWRGT